MPTRMIRIGNLIFHSDIAENSLESNLISWSLYGEGRVTAAHCVISRLHRQAMALSTSPMTISLWIRLHHCFMLVSYIWTAWNLQKPGPQTRALSVLEPCAGKLASTVLRGGNHRKMVALLDPSIGFRCLGAPHPLPAPHEGSLSFR